MTVCCLTYLNIHIILDVNLAARRRIIVAWVNDGLLIGDDRQPVRDLDNYTVSKTALCYSILVDVVCVSLNTSYQCT